MREKFHERLNKLREAKGWSLATLAKRSDLSERKIAVLESDPRQVPTWITIIKLASALGCNPFFLASGDGDHKPFRIRQGYGADVSSFTKRSR
jgi:transcriptional regulator with XRE-family HTH domain